MAKTVEAPGDGLSDQLLSYWENLGAMGQIVLAAMVILAIYSLVRPGKRGRRGSGSDNSGPGMFGHGDGGDGGGGD